MPTHDDSILRAALVGYRAERERIEQAMADIRRQLKVGSDGADSAAVPKKRHMSPAARKRIAAAQRKRWKEFHERQGAQK